MIKRIWRSLTLFLQKSLPFFVVTIGKSCISLILKTCRWEVRGLEEYKQVAALEKCILMLWHNRLAIAPSILYRYAPNYIYAAFVSNSRDGELISKVVHSYKAGRTIRVPHNARYEALRELIKHLEEKKDIVIITPDGPRGPRYKIKSGVAVAALETGAAVVPLTWTATKYWEFKTWDKLRIPKPFSTISVSFGTPVRLCNKSYTLEQAKSILQSVLRG